MTYESGKVHALIPARGGSKGILRKNLQKVNGVPLVGLKIHQAIESVCDVVWVSTDDEEIAKTAGAYGANIVMRPKELALDTSSTESCISHFLDIQEIKDNDLVAVLQVTSPLLEVKSINECILKVKESRSLNSSLTVRLAHPFIWECDSSLWKPVNHSRHFRPRRQDLPTQGYENGGCYLFRVEAFRSTGQRSPAPTIAVATSYVESIDIDTLEDLELVEQLLSSRLKKK